ncbi:MAG: hypothetical protein HXY51_10005 [Nitrospirae bacterium]|nr:hypothetical protein [Nitrospirota bacterium]
MQKCEIKVGVEYAFRESRKRDSTLQRIRILQHVRGKKWKVQWIDPNPGLTDYIESQNILVRWKDHKALLRDENHQRQIEEHNLHKGYKPDSPLDNAISEVVGACGDSDVSFYQGILSGKAEALDRIAERAHIPDLKSAQYGFIDRFGTVHLPFDVALHLAKLFSAAEPTTVLVNIESTERKWTQEASQPGGEYLVSLLNEYRASWALIRQWAGLDAAVAERESRIQQLERLVWDAIYALQKAGLDDESARLRRAIKRNL